MDLGIYLSCVLLSNRKEILQLYEKCAVAVSASNVVLLFRQFVLICNLLGVDIRNLILAEVIFDYVLSNKEFFMKTTYIEEFEYGKEKLSSDAYIKREKNLLVVEVKGFSVLQNDYSSAHY